jgi:phosphatidylinositol alpha-mannosyltransferase
MKIALVCPYELRRPGGVRSHIAGLGAALRARGHDVDVIAPTTLASLEGLPVISCGRARHLAFGGTQIDLTWASRRALSHVVRRGYDVMHFHTIWNPFVPFQLALRFRGPRIATFHDVPGPDTPAWARALMTPASELIRRAALRGVIAVSPSVSRYLADGHHEIIPNGIAVPDALPPDRTRDGVLYVGRLEPRKGIHTLLEAASILGAHGPRIRIAGDGYLRPELERFAAARGLTNVQFLGEVSEAQKWSLLREASLFVAPSLGGESFGIVLLEAMAAGTPPLGADNDGYYDVLAARADDLVFPAGDATALAARIRRLERDDARRAELARWGAQEWRRYDWSVLAPRIEQVYEAALA